MDRATYEEYLKQVNLGKIRVIADQYFDDSIQVTVGNNSYSKSRLLQLMDVTAEQMVETFDLVNFYQGEDGIAAEVKTKFLAKNDVIKEPFEEAGFPEGFVALKKGEILVVRSVYTYKIKDGKIVFSQGFAA